MKKIATGLTALALAASATLHAATTTAAAPAAAPDRKSTGFAFTGSGFGTRLQGGQVPANSDTTAFTAYGCTNVSGLDKKNVVDEVELPGAGTVGTVTTRLRTTQSGGVTSNISRSVVKDVVLAGSPLGDLELSAITSTARAFHGGDGFDATTKTTVAGITLRPAAGEPQEFEVPTPGQPIEVPGVATISLGDGTTRSNADGAKAIANGLLVELATGTKLRIAHTRATIERGVKSGLMAGNSYSVKSSALDGNLRIGRNPLTLMPCRGTDGDVVRKSLAKVNLGEDVELRNLTSREVGKQTRDRAEGYELGRVGVIELNDAEVVIRDVVGRVDITRVGRKLVRDIDTSIGAIVVQGQEQEFEQGEDVLEIPGIAKLERRIVGRTSHGAKVTALRITLLDALGEQKAVIDIGAAALNIRPALR
jgi:hypothetical protein